MEFVDEVLRYSTLGWRIHPLHFTTRLGEGVLCSCRAGYDCTRPGKHPVLRDWQEAATADPATIRRWWTHTYGGANIGLATGAASGVIVLDVDLDKGGAQSLLQLSGASSLSRLPAEHFAAPMASTGHGWHEYYRHPGGHIPNFVEFGGKAKGLDLRADGGNVVLPPSMHYTSVRYAWKSVTPFDVELPLPPSWLMALIADATEAGQPKIATHGVSHRSHYAAAALAGEIVNVMKASAGSRNNQLNRSAYKLGGLVGAGLLDRGEVERDLHDAAIAAGLTADETRRTIKSGLDAGIARPLDRRGFNG